MPTNTAPFHPETIVSRVCGTADDQIFIRSFNAYPNLPAGINNCA